MDKGNEIEFQGYATEMENFNYHHWIPCHTKFGREVTNPGGCNNPLAANFGRNSLVVEGLKSINYEHKTFG